jgi:glutamate carboxypeptidase
MGKLMTLLSRTVCFVLITFTINGWTQEFKWKQSLKEIVEINSGTQNTHGSQKVRDALRPMLEKIGFVTKEYDVGKGHKVVSYQHKDATVIKVLLVGHVDTVFPKEALFKKYIEKDGRIFGPGVIDMKGGVILMIHMLYKLRKNPELLKQVRLILNDDEEIGSPFSNKKFKELANGIETGLVFEPGLPSGNVVTSQSGVYWFELHTKGKASHAGLAHDEGLNACVELGMKAAEISRLTNYSKKFTVNLGNIQGGTKANVVCEEAIGKFDIRYVDQKLLAKKIKKIKKIAKKNSSKKYLKGHELKTTFKKVIQIPSLPEKSSKKPYMALRKVAKKRGLKIKGQHVGYGSDGNQLAPTGIQILVGLGPFGGEMHSDQEFMEVGSYEERLSLGVDLMKELLKE